MHGSGAGLLKELFTRNGVHCDEIRGARDPRFGGAHPEPIEPHIDPLRQAVLAGKYDAGFAADGDADRIGAIDGRGRILWGDQLLMLFARDILKRSPGATFVSEVKCSQALFDDIARQGGRAIMWKVGHSLIKAKMREEKAALAGEMSGHIFFADRWFGFDDAVYSGTRLCELLSHATGTLADLYDTLPVLHNTPEIRMACPDDLKFEVVERAVKWFRDRYRVVDVDGARIVFEEGGRTVGWGLVRASNTGPVLVMRFEAETEQHLSDIRSLVEDRLNQIVAGMQDLERTRIPL
jgi:phosphomannomutase/phosphoglucomutase